VRFFRRSPVKRLKDARDVGGLIALLGSGSTDERADAANALAELGAGEAEDVLISALADPEVEVRGQAIFALGQLRSTRAFPRIADFLHDSDWSLRVFAVNALTWIDHEQAVELVRPLADDEDELVRDQVRMTLEGPPPASG
jgi:HEAT repeat protein